MQAQYVTKKLHGAERPCSVSTTQTLWGLQHFGNPKVHSRYKHVEHISLRYALAKFYL
jgi:hypothetical protein